MSDILKHVHETIESVANVELSPPHPPREETPEYKKAHHFIVHEKKAGCLVCGVNIDTLHDPAINIHGATAVETHHYPIERSLADACDPLKVHKDFPQVYDRESLIHFVDSPANLVPLCSEHHRSTAKGIHHLLAQDFAVLKYLYDGYEIAANRQDAATVAAKDDEIEKAHGLES